jgi:hypothetical protein
MNGKPALNKLPCKARLPQRDDRLRPSREFCLAVRRSRVGLRQEADPHKSRRELELRVARSGE